MVTIFYFHVATFEQLSLYHWFALKDHLLAASTKLTAIRHLCPLVVWEYSIASGLRAREVCRAAGAGGDAG